MSHAQNLIHSGIRFPPPVAFLSDDVLEIKKTQTFRSTTRFQDSVLVTYAMHFALLFKVNFALWQ